jgi:hypothetical protein
VLRPGGRVVLLGDRCRAGGRAGPERVRRVDLRGGLVGAGFHEVEVTERPDRRAAELAMWQEAAALDPGEDAALRSFHDEGVRALEMVDLLRRVMATATAPTP